MKAAKPFEPATEVMLIHSVPNTVGAMIGQRTTVVSVSNMATKKNPTFRYFLSSGIWVDAEVIAPYEPGW